MKIKKFIIGIILLALTSCGYQPIYLNKNTSNISIGKIKLEGDKNVNRKIVLLANLKENNNKNSYDLILKTKKNTTIIAKDKSGNPSIYSAVLNVELTLKDSNNTYETFKTKKFRSSFSYNNIKNKFDLQRYQKTIEENLIDNIVEEIVIFLSS
jgi:hypothetical protein